LITNRIKTILKNKDTYSYNEFSLYKYSILTDIIEPDVSQEQKLIDFIDLEIQRKKEEKNKAVYCGVIYELGDLLKDIFYLLVYNKIIEVDNFKKYSKYSEWIKFILEDMNVEMFNPKWIVDFPSDLNKDLSSNEEIKKEIEKYIKSNLNKDEIKYIMETYFKYYCN
uniref:hypothetical protein n=3 Tax=Paraclostridium sordellii TaxID=1505 RepID=UPI0022E89F29